MESCGQQETFRQLPKSPDTLAAEVSSHSRTIDGDVPQISNALYSHEVIARSYWLEPDMIAQGIHWSGLTSVATRFSRFCWRRLWLERLRCKHPHPVEAVRPAAQRVCHDGRAVRNGKERRVGRRFLLRHRHPHGHRLQTRQQQFELLGIVASHDWSHGATRSPAQISLTGCRSRTAAACRP